MPDAARRNRALAYVIGVAATCGCGAPAVPADPELEASRARFSSAGIERVIPIRFIHPRITNDGLLNASMPAHYEALARLNATWRSAGVQFTIRSAESYNMPTLSRAYRATAPGGTTCCLDTTLYHWTGTPSIFTEMSQVPSFAVTSTSYATTRVLVPQDWMAAVPTMFNSDPESAVVWVQNYDASASTPYNYNLIGGFSSGPASYSMVMLHTGYFADQYGIAHEFGHFLNLPHLWSLLGGTVDPSTNAGPVQSDWWDLVYCPGSSAMSPHVYYHSRADALATGCSLWAIGTGSNCTVASNGFETCTLAGTSGYSETKSSSDWSLAQGMAASTPNAVAPSVVYGQNVMGNEVPVDSSGVQQYSWANLRASPSQVEAVRKTLRYETHTTDARWPDYAGNRTKLGRRPNYAPAMKVDFDGDANATS